MFFQHYLISTVDETVVNISFIHLIKHKDLISYSDNNLRPSDDLQITVFIYNSVLLLIQINIHVVLRKLLKC